MCTTSTDSVCTSCEVGYHLENNVCVENTQQACDLCAPVESNGCPAGSKCCGCGPGPGTCTTDTCLVRCSTTPCPVVCEDYQYLDVALNTCKECPIPLFCTSRTCTSDTTVTCHECEPGHVVENGACVLEIQQCQLCPSSVDEPCPTGTACCGCGNGMGTCQATCTLGCAVMPCPTPKKCDTCLSMKVQTCLEGTTCCGCGVTSTCETSCEVMCQMILPCNTDDREHQDIKVSYTLDVSCATGADSFKTILENHVKYLVGEWPGAVTVKQDSCTDGQKRAGSSTVESTVILDGPYADLTASAITNTMDPVLTTPNYTATLVSASAVEDNTGDGGSGGLSSGATAGIVIGCFFAFTLVLGAVAHTFHTSAQTPERV